MKFDPRAMEALLRLDDRSLWEKIGAIAAASGISLSKNPPTHEELERLREMMRGGGGGNVAEAMATIARYRTERGR